MCTLFILIFEFLKYFMNLEIFNIGRFISMIYGRTNTTNMVWELYFVINLHS